MKIFTPYILFFSFSLPFWAGAFQVDPGFHHVRNADPREWSHFPEEAGRQKYEVSFDLPTPGDYRVLTLRQKGTKQTWKVSLNGKQVGLLLRDHNHLQYGIELPADLLKEKANLLEIHSDSTVPDDIEIGNVTLWKSQFELDSEQAKSFEKKRGYKRALPRLSGKLTLRCTDGDSGEAIPCRFTVIEKETGALAFIGAESNDNLAVREGVVYSLNGEAEIYIDNTKAFRIYCGRGFEYSLAYAEVGNVEDVSVPFIIHREVATPGLAACDTHLHAYEYDRHGDCTLIERLISCAGEGVEIPVSTAHDKHIDFTAEAARIGADRWFTPVTGCEVTTSLGHFNSFPVDPESPVAVHKLRDWDRIFHNIFQTPRVKICILNHGRDVHRNFVPLGPENFDPVTGTFLNNRKLLANGMEIINSGATQTDPMQLVDDWFALLLSGHKIAAIGSSDSHTVNFAIPGQGRTYIRVPDDSDPAKLDIDAAVHSLLCGETWVSFGLLTSLERQGGKVSVKVSGPSWTTVDRVRVFRNRELVEDRPVDKESGQRGGLKFSADLLISVKKGDFLCAVATGPGIAEGWWPMMPPYQPDSPELDRYVFGMSPAVWVK